MIEKPDSISLALAATAILGQALSPIQLAGGVLGRRPVRLWARLANHRFDTTFESARAGRRI